MLDTAHLYEGRGRVKNLLMQMVLLMIILVAAAVPALAQIPVSMVDCTLGGPCIGTSGNDTITGSDKQDIISAGEGDDVIDPGNDAVTDYVYCGPGFDTVNQMPRIIPDDLQSQQYASEPDVIADDCEARAL